MQPAILHFPKPAPQAPLPGSALRALPTGEPDSERGRQIAVYPDHVRSVEPFDEGATITYAGGDRIMVEESFEAVLAALAVAAA